MYNIYIYITRNKYTSIDKTPRPPNLIYFEYVCVFVLYVRNVLVIIYLLFSSSLNINRLRTCR